MDNEQTINLNDDPNTDEIETQKPDTAGNDENKDGVKGGQATADVGGDILGI